jgi:hypothetical protein
MAGAGGWLRAGSENGVGVAEVGSGEVSLPSDSGVAPAGEAEEERTNLLPAKDAENTEGGRSDGMPEEATSDLVSRTNAEECEDGRSDVTPVGEAEKREGGNSAVMPAGGSPEHVGGREAEMAAAQRSGEAAGGVVGLAEERADEACISETEEEAEVEPGATVAVSLKPSAPAQSGSAVGEAAGASVQKVEEEGGGVSPSGGTSPQLSAKQEAAVTAAGERLRAMKHFELMTTAPEDHKFLDQLGQVCRHGAAK